MNFYGTGIAIGCSLGRAYPICDKHGRPRGVEYLKHGANCQVGHCGCECHQSFRIVYDGTFLINPGTAVMS